MAKQPETAIALKTKVNELPEKDTLNESCFWRLDLYTGKLHWSDGLCQLLGLSQPYTPTLEKLIEYYQPEKNIRPAFNRAIHQGIPFELELPVLTAYDKVISVYTLGSPVYDDYGKCIAVKGILLTSLQQEKDSKSSVYILESIEEQHIMLENFSRIVSHNLRSHTSNLQMVLESINQKTSSKQMRDMIGNIKTISSNLNQTVGYLNTLIKI
ncbi:PAS domain-containing protein [Mucilaginibacter arboris]|uniref:PAS domain-containing protein n=1 Tax=Mucilaginibacter arboris TaxID=2682090 RepID=A0A7K1SW37_9SPHI|nr:PAS domain-containing protein [Mucilaginibacter arboris]MVN21514.1 PAS domain-containing protein [Mucilaginibacter arboris]